MTHENPSMAKEQGTPRVKHQRAKCQSDSNRLVQTMWMGDWRGGGASPFCNGKGGEGW